MMVRTMRIVLVVAGVWICLLPTDKSFCHGEEGFFWHLTDIHYDPYYSNQESCSTTVTNPGKYGSFACDAPWDLVYSSIQAMTEIEGGANASFILWSGDNAAHAKNLSLLNVDTLLAITKNITDAILEEFPNTLVLPVIGNHDYYPKHQLPGENNTLYSGYTDIWSKWLTTTEEQDTFRRGAYYTQMLSTTPKVRSVILNTNLYHAINQATAGQEDPAGQFTWLEEVLTNASQNGEKVYLFYHIPPGLEEMFGDYSGSLRGEQNVRLVQLVTDYSDVILGMFSAHTHQDSFKIFYNDAGEAVTSLFIPASVTPWKLKISSIPGKIGPPHNPALRRYTFDKDTYQLNDVQQYYLNLTKANSMLKAEWQYLYSFKETYRLDNIRTGQLQSLLEKMKEPDSESFAAYFDLNTVHTKVEGEAERTCDCVCRTVHLCSIEYVDYDEYDECFQRKETCQQDSGSAVKCTGCVQGFIMCITVMIMQMAQWRY